MLTQNVFSQTARKYSNEFLNIGVDAAALGMSKSVTATSGDVNSIYWNPAGLAEIKINQAALMHTSYFAGIANYDYAAVAIAPKEKDGLVLAFSIIRFGVDDILNTTLLIDSQGNIDFNRISLFSAADYAFNFGIAKKNKNIKGLNVGLNTKLIRRKIGDFASSWGFGIDAGAQYSIKKWQFGLMVRDITTTVNTWIIDQEGYEQIKDAIPGENDELPTTTEITIPKVHIGIAKTFNFKNRDFQLLSEIDMHIRFAQTSDIISNESFSLNPSIGFQLAYKKLVYLRFGAGNFQNIDEFEDSNSLSFQPNIGLGFSYHGIQVDYALSNIASTGNALYSNTFSLKIDFDFIKLRKKSS
ncbi:PorV/PorQ family protein [Flavicella sp.]|uniref:putative type IX sorting system protein PorV2 n=1 Tax=Flavicella sp. TaxID=2957742 RepID=UPI0030158E59